jgi:hypothetical protein
MYLHLFRCVEHTVPEQLKWQLACLLYIAGQLRSKAASIHDTRDGTIVEQRASYTFCCFHSTWRSKLLQLTSLKSCVMIDDDSCCTMLHLHGTAPCICIQYLHTNVNVVHPFTHSTGDVSAQVLVQHVRCYTQQVCGQ